MAHSSWGSGWPNCQSGKINKNFVVKTVQGNVRFPGGIRFEIEDLVRRLVQETAKRGYRFGNPDDPSYGCWGFNCRAISGTNKPSNHSWGLAVDINAPRNPYTSPLRTDMPGWMPDLWNSYGFRWGGDYTTARKDAMHYEFLGSVAEAKSQTAKAVANNLGESGAIPLPPAPPEEDDEVPSYIVSNAKHGLWLVDGNEIWRRKISESKAGIMQMFGMARHNVDDNWFTDTAPLDAAKAPNYVVTNATHGNWMVEDSSVWRRSITQKDVDTHRFFGGLVIPVGDDWFDNPPQDAGASDDVGGGGGGTSYDDTVRAVKQANKEGTG